MVNTVEDVRENFVEMWRDRDFCEVAGTLEILGASFIADEDTIFGAVDRDYVQRELEWYKSRSLKIDDIPGGAPKIWRQVADKDGHINSNYGYLMFSEENYDQQQSVVAQLRMQPNGRRAVAVYTRPSIHVEWQRNGMSDFICTNAVNYYLRDSHLHAVVQMRSNDAVFGYRNDLAWQKFMQNLICHEVDAQPGHIIWQPGSLHVYQRHYRLIEKFVETGDPNVALR